MRNPAMSIVYIVIIIILLAIGYFSGKSGEKEVRSWEFKGVVEQVIIRDPKNNPAVIDNGKEYDLTNIKLNPNIGFYKGDTLIKKKGELAVKMIKANSRDTIYCNNR